MSDGGHGPPPMVGMAHPTNDVMIQTAQTVILAAMGFADDPQSHVLPHAITRLFSTNLPIPIGQPATEFWFTNHLLMTLVAAGLMLLVFVPIGVRYRALTAGGAIGDTVPRGFTNMIEGLMDVLRSGVVKPILGDDTDRFMPFLWTVFFFILFNNLLGMIPIDAFGYRFGIAHIGGTATGNVNVTAGLALCAFLMIHVSGIWQLFAQLIAGTYGQHHHDDDAVHEDQPHGQHGRDEFDPDRKVYDAHVHDEHLHAQGEHHGHTHAHVEPHHYARGLPAALALIAAPGIYVWNFAPHVFTVEGRKGRPGLAMKLVMAPLFAVELFLEYRLFGEALDMPDIFQWIGAALGVLYAFSAGGLRPLDFADAGMWGFLFALEVIGAAVKPFALCIRLFANMVAGHIVLASILALLPPFVALSAGYVAMSLPVVIGCVLLSCLELFVAFLQAYIFMFLTTIFVGAAVHPEH